MIRRPDGQRPALGVALLSAGLGAAALAVVVAGGGPSFPVVTLPAAPLLLAAGFALAERFVVHLPLGRQTHASSLAEVPLVVGLYAVDPLTLVVARLVGCASALLSLRVAPVKVAFNLCQWALETAIAASLWWAIASRGEPLGPAGWLGVLVAVAVVNLVGAAAVLVAMRLHDGAVPAGALREAVASGALPQLANASIGIAAVALISADWRVTWTLVVFLLVLFLGQRAHRILRQRHDELERLNDFTGSVVTERSSAEVARVVLAQLLEQLSCARAEVALFQPWQHWTAGSGDDTQLLVPQADELALPVLAPRGTRDVHGRRLLAHGGLRDAMVVGMTGDDGVIGTIAVADRLGDTETFTSADLAVLQALANHAGIALSNARLNDQLREQMDFSAHQALHDALTGLPNRRSLIERIDGAGTPVAVLLLDVDRFKEVNDTLGHATGDELLCALARRLEVTFPDVICVARLGGDEFAVAMEADDAALGLAAAARARSALEESFDVAGLSLSVEASIGVAWADEPDAGPLLRQADVAMYIAKQKHSGVELYSPEHDGSSRERLLLYTELREAITAGDLVLHFQPKIDVATRAVKGFEALVRWNHRERGLVPPDVFIPLAEQSGLIHPLTSFVIQEALLACREWRSAGHKVGVAVNIAPRSLAGPQAATEQDAAAAPAADLTAELASLLWQVDLPASALTIEITEGSIMNDPARAIEQLERLRGLGIRVSVDDLGTGYSSLGYLKRLPVDEMKIDRAFVRNLAADADDQAIVEAVVALGSRLGKQVVAEGVEDEATLDKLDELGCDLAQGYHVSRPLPADDVIGWLERSAAIGTPASA